MIIMIGGFQNMIKMEMKKEKAIKKDGKVFISILNL
jgi:hypothetical protein